MPVVDPNSYAEPLKCTVSHFHLQIDQADFEAKVLSGSVILYIKVLEDVCSEVVLDSRQLVIESVEQAFKQSDKVLMHSEVAQRGAELFSKTSKLIGLCEFAIGKEHAAFGSPLKISLVNSVPKGAHFFLKITYKTTPACTAAQWMEPDQTSSKKHPYLFTQCQAIHARSLLPCQDTPAVKSTYSAQVSVSKPLKALMSALPKGSENVSGTLETFKFHQPIPIPSYLIALAIGDLHSLSVGPRSNVWSESTTVKAAQAEFEDTELFLKTAEKVVNPYIWTLYDMVLLPGSYPYGGMENTCLTFLTPTLIAGDKSLVDVVAHEISHSWAGNLVTNKNWQHFWLNEGFCVYIERQIIKNIHGEPARQFKSIIGWNALHDSIKHFGNDNPLTCLVVDLNNVDPDDAFSSVPYEKGYNLLYQLECLVGGCDVFLPYLKSHFDKFKYQSIDTDDWKSYLFEYFREKHPEKMEALKAFDWNTWLHKPGMPPISMPFDTSLAQQCKKLIEFWKNVKHGDTVNSQEYDNLSTDQKIVFFEWLSEIEVPLAASVLGMLNQSYKLDVCKNFEIRFRWYQVCLKAKYVDILPQVSSFLQEQGRMKYIRPTYRALLTFDEGKQLALDTFTKHRNFYHPVAAQMVAKDLKLHQ